jgi:hypothetical protein
MGDGARILPDQLSLLFGDCNSRATIKAAELFHTLARVLSGVHFEKIGETDDYNTYRAGGSKCLFLYGDFGWSISFNTEGRKDPAEVTPHFLRLMPGTPTDIRTGKRNCILRGGPDFHQNIIPDSFPLPQKNSSWVPRCAGKAIKQFEYWASRRDEFQLTLRTHIEPSPE